MNFTIVPKIKITRGRNTNGSHRGVKSYVEMMFVDDRNLPMIGNNIKSQWEGIYRKYQAMVHDFSGRLNDSGEN